MSGYHSYETGESEVTDEWDGIDRRGEATVIDMLRQQQTHTQSSLEGHVQDCSKMQKRVLLIVAATLVWLVAHSPEAAHLVAKAFPTFPAVGG